MKVIIGITLGIVLLYVVFHPMLDRGTICVRIHNTTPEPITVQFRDTDMEATTVPAGLAIRLPYEVRYYEDSITLNVQSSLTSVTKSVVLEEYVEPMYYGLIKVKVSFDEDEGDLTVKTDSWIRL